MYFFSHENSEGWFLPVDRSLFFVSLWHRTTTRQHDCFYIPEYIIVRPRNVYRSRRKTSARNLDVVDGWLPRWKELFNVTKQTQTLKGFRIGEQCCRGCFLFACPPPRHGLYTPLCAPNYLLAFCSPGPRGGREESVSPWGSRRGFFRPPVRSRSSIWACEIERALVVSTASRC